MKKIILLSGITLSLFAGVKSEAQVRVNIQFGAPVALQSWYNNDDDYYYMPEQGVYYNVRRQCYVYPEGGRWLYANSLPSRYGGFTYGSSHYYRVRDRAPFSRNDYYRRQYPVAYNGGNRGNNAHDYGRRNNGNDRGWDRNNSNGRGWDRNNGNGTRDNRDYNTNGRGGGRSNDNQNSNTDGTRGNRNEGNGGNGGRRQGGR